MKKFLLFIVILLTIKTGTAESIILGEGTWIIGEDVPAGHYEITTSSVCTAVICDVITGEGAADFNNSTIIRWISHKNECVLLNGHYLEISLGKMYFYPIKPTIEQQSNTNYMAMLNYRHQAIFNNYEDTCDLYHRLDLGTYTVGVDIPQGSWQIQSWGNAATIVTVQDGNSEEQYRLYNPGLPAYKPGYLTDVYIPLKDGMVVKISNNTGKTNTGVYFIPFSRPLSDW